jgi:hypothetical protein
MIRRQCDAQRGRHMRQEIRWWFMIFVIMTVAGNGCATDHRTSSKPLSTDNVRFMDMWNLYSHCTETDNLDVMLDDAQQLSRALDVLDAAADPRIGPSVRLSADPAAMAASCALRTGQVAKEQGRHSSAREMFQLVLTNFPQPRYAYYTDQAREGLEQLNAANSG